MRHQVAGDEALLRAYYEAHKGEYEQVRASHILIRMHGSPLSLAPGQKDLTEEEALAKAREIREKIVAGAEFADMARVESDDRATASKGGDMDFVRRGQTIAVVRGRAVRAQARRTQPAGEDLVRLPPD